MQRASHALCRMIGPAVTPGSACSCCICCWHHPVSANSRRNDVAEFEGVRDNLLVGYGLVVGLNGTGEVPRNSAFTDESLRGRLNALRSARAASA